MFGAHSFRSTVYCMQDPGTIGAHCAQMCMIMALGMLADRHAEVVGSFTLTFLNWHLEWLQTHGLQSLDEHNDQAPVATFPVKGMTPRQIRMVLQSPDCNAWAHTLRLPNGGTSRPTRAVHDHQMLRIIEAYVAANFPIIAAVNTRLWQDPGNQALQNAEPHAVVIIGLRSSVDGQPVSLIVHDPASQPFFECPWKYFAAAASAYLNDHTYHLVAVTDRELVAPAYECLQNLQCGLDARLFKQYAQMGGDADFRIRLLQSHSIAAHVLPKLEDPRRWQSLAAHLDAKRYWCILGLRRGCVEHAWLFDAESNPALRPGMSRHQHRLSVLGPYGRDVNLDSFDSAAGRWSSRRI
jgi:hypothetical protein